MYNYEEEAKKLISQMTLEEKVSQILHESPAIERLNIPSYNWWNEALHGVARAGTATVFPQAIGLAATFDDELLFDVADAISTEGRAKFHAFQEENDHDIYKGLTFWSPNINIFRDPRWGRGHETYGEDPHLTAKLGLAFIKGLQGDGETLKTAACAKHFAVHSGPEDERHSFNAECNSYDLWNTYLHAFDVAVNDGDVAGVMGAYNRTNGEACCGSKTLLVDILREKWGFDGYITSDAWAVRDFHESHKVTASPAESAALAINCGCDLNCGNMYPYAVDAIKEGLLTEEAIDKAVLNLLMIRMKLGLLGAPDDKKYTNIPYSVVDCDEHNDLSLRAAREGIVLLKNNGTLPLKKDKIKSIGIIGPNANSRRSLVGNYEGTASRYITVLNGMRELANEENIRIHYAEGCHLFRNKIGGLAKEDNRVTEAVTVAKNSDAVVLCLGLDADIEGEAGDTGNEYSSGDKNKLDLPGRQQALLETVKQAAGNKPVIVVLISGSALSVTWADKNADGIIQAFYPGAMGGRAVAEIIFGRISPSGKLPVTFYRSTDDLPDFRNYDMKDRTYRYFNGDVLYPFGFGLSYSKFQLSDFTADENGCTVTVKNTGNMDAAETVQIYVSSNNFIEISSLIGFKKIALKAGGSEKISIPFDKRAFARYDENGNLVKKSGEYTLCAYFSAPGARSEELNGAKPLVTTVNI